jgi:hypothetical protein
MAGLLEIKITAFVLQHSTALFTIIAAATRFIKLKNDIFARFMMIMESGAFFLESNVLKYFESELSKRSFHKWLMKLFTRK